MGNIRFYDNKILFVGNQIAMHDDCCCEDICCGDCICDVYQYEVNMKADGEIVQYLGDSYFDTEIDCCFTFGLPRTRGYCGIVAYISGVWRCFVGAIQSSGAPCTGFPPDHLYAVNCSDYAHGTEFNLNPSFSCLGGGSFGKIIDGYYMEVELTPL
jgi:hypothetical protein